MKTKKTLPGLKTHIFAAVYILLAAQAGVQIDPQDALTFDWDQADLPGMLLAAMISALRAGVAKIEKILKEKKP